MTHKTLLTLTTSLLLTLTAATTAIAEFKMATVDVARLLNETKFAQKEKSALDKHSKKIEGDIKSRGERLAKVEEKLKAGKISPDSKEAENFRKDARDLSRLVKDTKEDLQKRFLKLNRKLSESALASVKRYAESKSIDLVIDKSTQGRSPVLFGAKSADITDEVLSLMNKNS